MHDLIRARFEQVRRSLTSELDALTDDLLTWAPRAGMRTCGGMLFEIAGKEVELLTYARHGGLEEWVEIESFGPREASIEGWRDILAEVRAETLVFLDSMSLDKLDDPVRFPGEWWEGLYLKEVPMHEIFRSIAAHEWYHTGQLVSYQWMRGVNPYDD